MKKILLIEDDSSIYSLYKLAFSKEGYEIDIAHDGVEGLSKVSANMPDIILLDIILPRINGLEVMEQLKGLPPPQNPNKCVIFLTNLDKGEEIERGLKLGNGYLIKSQITPGDLIREVGLYLSSSSHPNPQ